MSGGGAAGGYGFNDLVVVLLVVVVAALVVMAVMGPSVAKIAEVIGQMAHADVRHGSEAAAARQCAERPDWIFFNPQTQRTAFGCMTDMGKFGLFIMDSAGREITAFLKNKFNKVDQLFQYMRNTGYELVP